MWVHILSFLSRLLKRTKKIHICCSATFLFSVQNQNNLLISNGYSYVPEYKYNDLIKKFIQGCEESGIKLNWKIVLLLMTVVAVGYIC